MAPYPPPQIVLLQVFQEWLGEKRSADYKIKAWPDVKERSKKDIDYLLGAREQTKEIAVEVSTIWRTDKAGSEDAYLLQWASQVNDELAGNIKGEFRVYVPGKIPKNWVPNEFAKRLLELVKERGSELENLPPGHFLRESFDDVSIDIVQANTTGSKVSFGRYGVEAQDFQNVVSRILQDRGPKLKPYKNDGFETWLLVYNTFWTVIYENEVKGIFDLQLQNDYPYIDHIGVVAGNPPDDAWIYTVR